MMPKAVIFDVGGVLMYDVWEHLFFDDEGSIAALYGIDRERLEETGKVLFQEFAFLPATETKPWQALELLYWERFLELSEEDISSTVEPGDLIDLAQEFIQPVGHGEALSVLDALAAQNTVLSIASNNTEFWFHRQMAASGFSKYFTPERTLLSSRMGVSKADASGAMFTRAIKVSGVGASEILFVDDREENLARAAALGIETFLFPAEDAQGYTKLKIRLGL